MSFHSIFILIQSLTDIMCSRSCVSVYQLLVLWRFTWDQTLLESVLVHSYSCIYFLTGSSVMMMVVHVSHGLAPEQPRRVTLGLVSGWTREMSGRLGHKPDIKSLDMLSLLVCIYLLQLWRNSRVWVQVHVVRSGLLTQLLISTTFCMTLL